MSVQLVTGGAGFIGSHIVSALVERGDRVRVLDNLSSGHLGNLEHVRDDVDFQEGDVRDPDVVARALEDVEVVFHQAALASVPQSVSRPLDSHAHCVTATVNLLDGARHSGVRRVVFASSSAVYGDSPVASKRETDYPQPVSPYAAAKIACEHYLHAFAATYGLETVALRYFNVFGPRQDPLSEYAAVIPKFVTSMIDGQRPIVFGDGRQTRDFVFVGDVAQWNLAAAAAEGVSGRRFNVGCGRQLDLLDLIAAINDTLGTHLQPIFEPERAGDVRDSLADISMSVRDLGYRPQVEFAAGLRRSIDYYKSVAVGV